MGSCGNLASAAKPLSSVSEVAEELVSEELAGGEASLCSSNCYVGADQTSSRQSTHHSGIHRDFSLGHCDRSSLVVSGDDHCIREGNFEWEDLNKVNGSYLEEDGFSVEVCPENLQNADDMAFKVTSGIGSRDNPCDWIETDNGMQGDEALLKRVNSVKESVDDLLVLESSSKWIHPLIVTRDACHNELKVTLESQMFVEEVFLGQDGLMMNDQKDICHLATCSVSVEEKVHDLSEVKSDSGSMESHSEASGIPIENVRFTGYPYEKSRKYENKLSGIEIEACIDVDSHESPSNENDGSSDNSLPADCLCCDVPETVQEDNKSVKRLSSKEVTVEVMRETSTAIEVEAGTCIKNFDFQIIGMPMEEKNALLKAKADSNVRLTLFREKMPIEQSNPPDCITDSNQMNELESGVLLSGMPIEMFSGIEGVKIDDLSCQILPSKDDLGTLEGVHTSSILSSSSQMDGMKDSNGAPKVYLEHVKEGNVHAIGLQSCEAHSTVNCCSEKSSLDLDVPKMVVAAAATSIADNDYPTINNHEIKRDGGSECVPATKSSLVMVSSSRSNRVKKSGRKTQTKKASSYSKITKKVTRNYEALELIFKASKKKRTCFSKMPRSSTWGVMQNVSQNSEYINGTGIEAAQKQGPQKVGIVQGSGKQSINKPDGTSQPSKENAGSSSNRIRLKVKMGKEIFMVSEVNGPASSGAFASARSGATSSNVAKLTNDIKEKNQLEHVNANRKSYHCDSLMNGDPILIAKESTQNGGGCLQVTHAEIGPVGVMTEDRYLSSGTSPDSEVVDLMPEAQIGERHQEIINTVALDSSKSLATCEDVLQTRKVKNKDKAPRQSSCRLKDKSLSSKRRTCKVKGGEKFDNGENALPFTIANHLSNSSRNAESVNVSCNSDLAFLNGSLCVEGGDNTYPDQDISIGSMDLKDEKNHFPSYEKMKGKKQVKSSKSGRVCSGISKGVKSTKSKKEYSCKQKKDSEKLTRKSKVKEKFVYNQLLCKTEDHSLTGNNGTDGDKKTKGASHTWIYDDSKSEITSNSLAEQQLPQPNAWVRCDDCYKWRRIAAALADSIADSNWICKDNLDKRFADCSIPQEMSNADINAELELSDYSCEDDYYDGNQNYKELKCSRPTVSQQSSFIQIDSNKFLHRSQRTQTIDEVMVCHCKPPLDGKLGCGDECLNRMLNIECVQGTCPCGDLCSNQQFQRRNYAKLQWFRCGRKGYGLQLLKDVSKGDFIIEYVGEVLDIPTYEERQRNYAANGHKHFYFMTLNGGEVIDACSKGNLGRFINHSCDPNCQTEKWMVNGEICIGLFAIRDIKKGEEVTFDYNYVRVFGAAAKKCVCGSPLCRGYIGGDLQSTETIVQGDSDDEFPEPIMLNEDGDVSYKFDNTIPVRGSDILIEDLPVKPKNEVIREVESTLGSGDPRSLSVPCISHPDKSLAAERRLEKALPSKPHEELSVISHDVITRPLSELQQNISMDEDASDPNPISTPEMNEPPGRSVSDEKRSMTELHYLVKVRRSNGTVKKSKGSGNLQNPNKGQGIASKSQMVSSKPKKAIEGTSNGRFEAVQEKLNELLDADGGISKRKDAPKGYLKLLLLTAASGDNNGNGEAIQSNRDLSMILDALLKTRSRVVLMDIISKNGLRMLHNILKQYRRDFKKIPILRKLLKVLEYLASRDILTLDHIIVGPPCPGMESLRESILSLTEHEDKQVHQIARSFRDRWIPRHLRKIGFADWDGQNFTIMGSQGNWQDAGLSRTSEAAACPNLPSISAPTSGATDSSSIDGGSSSGTRKPKRKTRWDSDTNPYLESLIKLKEKSADTVGDGKEGIVEEEGPPGFSSPLDTSGVSSNSSSTPAALDQSSEKDQYARCPFDAVIGQPQERFKSQLQVSYGVPLLILQCGVPQAGSKESWAIAPGMPFHPFPPLPPFPRERKRPCPSSSSDCETSVSTTVHSSAEEKQPENLGPCSYGASLAGSEAPYSENQQTMPNKRWKVSSQDMGRRYFRQQKWNGPKMPPPWVRNSWRNSNPRGGSGSCPGPYENAVDCKIGRDDSNYHQHMQQPNHH
ncbi:hypothetical protein SAY87_020780 [Trapa incisa]|uniref:Histone-lysine N-methyltransferase ASHH2 n=1 Tax=Trapa incisa TaxID=236973 RepID=A0AAN7PN82_9MYRT|nr:hypothetical protein SAY87_020780 [Trapa incisa]